MKTINYLIVFFLLVFILFSLPLLIVMYGYLENQNKQEYQQVNFFISGGIVSCVALICLFFCFKEKMGFEKKN